MATISNVNGKKITKIKYKGEIYDTGGGTDWLKELLDEKKTTKSLFCGQSYLGNGTYTIWYSYLTYELLQKILSYNTTSNVTSMFGMFYYCNALTTIPLLDTSSVTETYGMFEHCHYLTTTPQINTNKVTDMRSMYAYCYRLTNIDITKMSTSNNSYFAYNCNSLTKLVIRNMPTIPTLETNAFGNCYHFTGKIDSKYNPQGLKDGRIYVPDDKVEALKTATNWSVYADIIVPLSTLVE